MKNGKILWGILLILGAVLLLFSQTAMVKSLNLDVWSVVLSAFLIVIFVENLVRVRYFGIFFSLACLGIIHAEWLGITELVPWILLGAALLLSIGFSILFPRKKKDWNVVCNVGITEDDEVVFGEKIHQDFNEEVKQTVTFGSAVKYINSTNFKRAHFECNFGAMKVYFTGAEMQSTEATVFVENNFGGVELYVPKGWRVENRIENAFAGVNEKGVCNSDGQHTLFLMGENNFGGITILYL